MHSCVYAYVVYLSMCFSFFYCVCNSLLMDYDCIVVSCDATVPVDMDAPQPAYKNMAPSPISIDSGVLSSPSSPISIGDGSFSPPPSPISMSPIPSPSPTPVKSNGVTKKSPKPATRSRGTRAKRSSPKPVVPVKKTSLTPLTPLPLASSTVPKRTFKPPTPAFRSNPPNVVPHPKRRRHINDCLPEVPMNDPTSYDLLMKLVDANTKMIEVAECSEQYIQMANKLNSETLTILGCDAIKFDVPTRIMELSDIIDITPIKQSNFSLSDIIHYLIVNCLRGRGEDPISFSKRAFTPDKYVISDRKLDVRYGPQNGFFFRTFYLSEEVAKSYGIRNGISFDIYECRIINVRQYNEDYGEKQAQFLFNEIHKKN